jgi:uncharacterized membrane protein YhaH (DUF805 family)
MEKIKNIHQISAWYFFLLAFTYVITVLMFRNNIATDLTILIMRLLDIPFALVALLYGGSTLYLQLNENEEVATPWAIFIVAVCILFFSLVVFINFAFPSQI